MKTRWLISLFLGLALISGTTSGFTAGVVSPAVRAAPQAIQAPELKWQRGGCYDTWCETGWYSSPAVADLDGDGQAEIVASAYSIFVLDGVTGALEWRAKSGYDITQPDAESVGRTWPGVVVADIDNDGQLEIATAHGGGVTSVYNAQGYFEPGWPKQEQVTEMRGLGVADLDRDDVLEVVSTAAYPDRLNTWVYQADGSIRPGWPQLNNDSGVAAGVFNDNAAIGDLDGDTYGEVIVPSDVHYINAYERDGTQIPANPMYGGNGWGNVGVWEDPGIELRGWGQCGFSSERAERFRANFTDGASVIADVNSDGYNDVVAVGNVYDCGYNNYPSKYMGVYVFNADRSRLNDGLFDWRYPPVDTGAPVVENYDVIETVMPNPVVADLDGDGYMEIVYASYDGRVHAFWLDKTEHGNWPYSVYQPAEGFYRFASEPAIADLDNDGHAEVIFASWTQKGSGQTGKLHILDYLGNPLHEVPLPAPFGGGDWNGALAAPTLANVDEDADLEIALNTAHSGVVVYDLPGTADADVLWRTGRGNYSRNGAMIFGTVAGTRKLASAMLADPGDPLTYSILARNPGPTVANATITDTLPTELAYVTGVASSGVYSYTDGVITWQGTMTTGIPITITIETTIDPSITETLKIINTVQVTDNAGHLYRRSVATLVNGYLVYLPAISR